ncbi:MAG TPA: IS110 family transposase [Polyangia bacterium]|nr:IS110 family transposase [Polyangia bacterium]
MAKSIRYVGLDVHADTIAVAVAEAGAGEVRFLGTIPNRPEAIRKLIRRLEPVSTLRVCYEAGPTGYALYWQLTGLGVKCEVVAPTLVPVKAGDRVKTDRRDAEKLARCYRAGELTPVWVPDAAHEALRDVVRAREAAKGDELRAKHRLGKFLLRHGRRPPEGTTPWTKKYWTWLNSVHFEYRAQEATLVDYRAEIEHAADRVERLEKAIDEAVLAAPAKMRAVIEALQALRGVAKITATTLAVEVGNFSRFAHPRLLMGYGGVVPSEFSTGKSKRQGAITKTGNAHVRHVLVESSWSYRHRPNQGGELRRRQKGLSEEVKAIAWKAQNRLHNRYWRLTSKGKAPGKAITAVARELLGFIWAIGVRVETTQAAA